MGERQTAMQIAWTQEFSKYLGTFFGLAAVGLIAEYEVNFLTESINTLHLYFYISESSFCIIRGRYFCPLSNCSEVDHMTKWLISVCFHMYFDYVCPVDLYKSRDMWADNEIIQLRYQKFSVKKKLCVEQEGLLKSHTVFLSVLWFLMTC